MSSSRAVLSPTVIPEEIPNLVDGERTPAARARGWTRCAPPTARSLPPRAVRSGGHRRGGDRGSHRPAGVGRPHPGRTRRDRPRARLESPRAPGGSVRDRRRRDRKDARARARRDGRGRRDGSLRRRRGTALLRPHDDREHASSHRSHRAAAARGGGPDHELQHAAPEPRVEDLPGGLLRQRRGGEALRARPRLRALLRRAGPRVGRAAGRVERRAGAWKRGGRGARRARGRRPRELHRLGRDRALDQRDGRTATGQGVPRAGRQERARRLRRRGSRERGALGARIGVLERRTAVRGGKSDRRLRRRLRGLPRSAARGNEGARAGAGDQRSRARAHAGRDRAGRHGRSDGADGRGTARAERDSILLRPSSKAPLRTTRSPGRSCSAR